MAGELGGQRIDVPPGRSVRPTPERVREAWFSALGDRVREARVVDLFAGSGALGIEALSRGAAHVDFVEVDRRAAAAIRANVERLGLARRCRISRRDAFRWLAERDPGEEPYDLALADPPYGSGAVQKLVTAFRAGPFARLLCVERAPAEPLGCEPCWERRYGDTVLSFLTAEATEDPARGPPDERIHE